MTKNQGMALGLVVAMALLGAGSLAQTPAPAQPSDAKSFQPPAPPPPGKVENGKVIYKKYGCYQCHGLVGQGSPSSGPRLGPEPMLFPAFAKYVREPKAEMPVVHLNRSLVAALVLTIAGTIYLGLSPAPLLSLAEAAAKGLLGR
jgi:mono/diheme cytochrome c family protein